MEATVTVLTDPREINMSNIAPVTRNVIDVLKTQFNSASSWVGNVASNFIESAKEKFNYFTENSFIDKQIDRFNAIGDDDSIIKYLGSTYGLINAGTRMREVVMNHPKVRDLHRRQLLNGYDGLYFETNDNPVEETDFYKYVTNGVVKFNGEEEYFMINYVDERTVPTFSEREKMDINSTWDFIDYHFKMSEKDFTSKFNEEVGKI